MRTSTKLVLTSSFAAMLAAQTLSPTDARAQAANTTQQVGSEVVIVTAQRRAQDIQQVPASVTALGGAQLEQRQVANVLDLQYQVPNISIATGTGTANSARIFLRGVGEDESRGAVDPAIAVYVDGIYMGRQLGSLFSLVDLERVEVLRGPQGTLYGRASNGGAIKLVSQRPNDSFGGEIKAGIGNFSSADLRATVNIPLSDVTAVRATAMYKNRAGFHQLNPNGDRANFARNVGIQDVGGARISLAHDFSADWNLLIAYDITQDNSDPTPDSAQPGRDRDTNIFTIEPLPGVTCGPATTSIGCFSDYRSKINSEGLSVNLAGKIGTFDVMSLTGARSLKDDLGSRIGSPYFQQTQQDQVSQEFTLTSNFKGPFNFVAGLYHFHENVTLATTFVFPFVVDVKTISNSGFLHGTFNFSEKLKATAGIRYTDETKTFSGINRALNLGRNAAADFDTTSYTAGLDYEFSDTLMVYGSYSTGFKPGGWSPDCFSGTSCFLAVGEEEVRTLEIGARTSFLDKTLRFNATYFSNQYEGLQIGATVPGVGFTRFNVDETEIQGLEFEASWRPNSAFFVFANLGLLDANYKSLTLSQASALLSTVNRCAGGVATIQCALELKLKNAPEYKGVVGASYTMTLGKGDLVISGDVAFEDESWSLVANNLGNALIKVDPLYNAKITYSFANGWKASLWGQNLADQEYWRAASSGTAHWTTYAAPPRTWGVDLGIKF
jgi:iron complex outermembrane recepter protein